MSNLTASETVTSETGTSETVTNEAVTSETVTNETVTHEHTAYKTEKQREEDEWKAIQRLALDYDDTKTFEENEEINPNVAYAWERAGERKLKEKMELIQRVYASMGIIIQ